MDIGEVLSPRGWLSSVIGDNLPSGPVNFPYLGILEFIRGQRHPIKKLMQNVRNHGRIHTSRVLGIKLVWLIGPEANQHVLVENPENFSWREGMMNEFSPFLGTGLLNTDGTKHDVARELMEPAFRPDRLRSYADRMVQQARSAVDQLRHGDEFDLYDWTQELALGVATRILFGMESDSDLCGRLKRAFNRGLGFYEHPIHLRLIRGPYTPYRTMKNARQTIDEIVFDEIADRRQRESPQQNILDLLVHAEHEGTRFSDQEVRDQMMHLLFAGHDTTTATVAWMVTLLGRNAHVYRRLRDHIDENLGERTPDYDDLTEGLPYLNQVLDETLRLYPPAWIGPRKARNDFEIYGETIPGDTQVAYSSLLTHRLPSVFENPEMFDPGRFTPEKKRQIPPGGYVPFGRGARTCIGMNFGKLEVKAIITSLIQNHDFELVSGQDFRVRHAPTLSPRYGVGVRVHERDTVTSVNLTQSQSDSDDQATSSSGDCPVHED